MTDDGPVAPTGDTPSGSDAPVQRPASPEQWEEVGRRTLGVLLQERRDDLDSAVAEVVATLDYGTPVDETHLSLLRDAIAGLEVVAEHDLTDLVPEATPFERTADRIPAGRLSDALDSDEEEPTRPADDG